MAAPAATPMPRSVGGVRPVHCIVAPAGETAATKYAKDEVVEGNAHVGRHVRHLSLGAKLLHLREIGVISDPILLEHLGGDRHFALVAALAVVDADVARKLGTAVARIDDVQ